MWSMQCNVELWYQLSICSVTEENCGKHWSNWLVAGHFGCRLTLTSSPALYTRTLTIVPIQLLPHVKKITYLSCMVCFIFWISSETLFDVREDYTCVSTHTHTNTHIYIYIYIYICDYSWCTNIFGKWNSGVLWDLLLGRFKKGR
jgi:hypothetical protein